MMRGMSLVELSKGMPSALRAITRIESREAQEAALRKFPEAAQKRYAANRAGWESADLGRPSQAGRALRAEQRAAEAAATPTPQVRRQSLRRRTRRLASPSVAATPRGVDPNYRRKSLKGIKFRVNADRVMRQMDEARPPRRAQPPFAEQRAHTRTEIRFSAARRAGEQQRAADAAARAERNRKRATGAAAAVGGTAAVAGGAVAARRALRHVALRKPVEGLTNSQKALVGAGTGAAGAMLLHERSARR